MSVVGKVCYQTREEVCRLWARCVGHGQGVCPDKGESVSVMAKVRDHTREKVCLSWARCVTRQGRKCVGHGQGI